MRWLWVWHLLGCSCCFCQSVCTCAALVDRYRIKCIYHPWPCPCPLSCPACRVLQGKSIRGPRWTGVSPVQGESGMFQRCQRGGSIIVILLLFIVPTAAAAAHKRRYAWVESASLSQEAAAPMGAAVIRSPGSVYLAYGKSLCTRRWVFMPSWKPSKHLQRRFDPGSMEQKSQGRELRKKGPKVVCKEGGRNKYCASSVLIAFEFIVLWNRFLRRASTHCQLLKSFRQMSFHGYSFYGWMDL